MLQIWRKIKVDEISLRKDELVAHSDCVVHKYGQELLLREGNFFESWHVETVTANAKETGCVNLLRNELA
jgi:hypothetical protein